MEEGFCLAGCHVVAQTQGYLVVCIGVARSNSRGGGVGLFEKPCFVPDLDLKSFSTGTYHCPLKLSVSLKWRRGFV